MAKQPEPTPDDDTPPEPRLRKVPAVVTDRGLAVIRQAITLKQATHAHLEPLSDGEALVLIAAEWNRTESARISERMA